MLEEEDEEHVPATDPVTELEIRRLKRLKMLAQKLNLPPPSSGKILHQNPSGTKKGSRERERNLEFA